VPSSHTTGSPVAAPLAAAGFCPVALERLSWVESVASESAAASTDEKPQSGRYHDYPKHRVDHYAQYRRNGYDHNGYKDVQQHGPQIPIGVPTLTSVPVFTGGGTVVFAVLAAGTTGKVEPTGSTNSFGRRAKWQLHTRPRSPLFRWPAGHVTAAFGLGINGGRRRRRRR
jgi:hypothetical protein